MLQENTDSSCYGNDITLLAYKELKMACLHIAWLIHIHAENEVLREQKGWDRGRWVGAPEGCKQHGRVWAGV